MTKETGCSVSTQTESGKPESRPKRLSWSNGVREPWLLWTVALLLLVALGLIVADVIHSCMTATDALLAYAPSAAVALLQLAAAIWLVEGLLRKQRTADSIKRSLDFLVWNHRRIEAAIANFESLTTELFGSDAEEDEMISRLLEQVAGPQQVAATFEDSKAWRLLEERRALADVIRNAPIPADCIELDNWPQLSQAITVLCINTYRSPMDEIGRHFRPSEKHRTIAHYVHRRLGPEEAGQIRDPIIFEPYAKLAVAIRTDLESVRMYKEELRAIQAQVALLPSRHRQ